MYRTAFGQPVEKGVASGNMEQVSSEVDVWILYKKRL